MLYQVIIYDNFGYSGARGGDPAVDKANFVTVLKELRAAFGTRYLLTSAVAIGKDTIDVAYDVPQLNLYLDQIHVMSYDFHGAWEVNYYLYANLYNYSLLLIFTCMHKMK